MIDAGALRRQAANKYPEVVEALLRGESPFPIRLRYQRIKTTDARETILRDVEVLKRESREHLGFGLTIEWTEIDTTRYGRNLVPGDVALATEADFLGYVGKRDEVQVIRVAADVLSGAFPEIGPRLPELWRIMRSGSREFWNQVIHVVSHFQRSPFPERYIRELPIQVPTKFIEENSALIERLVEVIAPHALRTDGVTFEERLGLKTPDALVECRLLDDQILPGWKFRQFTVGLRDLSYLGELPAHTIVISENRTNFLTLPAAIGTIALQGQGYAVSRLKRSSFLASKRIFYWGDLDAQGFEILAVLRRDFPQVESLMMDRQTWLEFPGYRVDGVRSRNRPEQFLPYLTEAEAGMFTKVMATNARLEQERIPQEYVKAQFSQKLAVSK